MTNNSNIGEEYSEQIKTSIENGSFFKESLKWYMFQYNRPTVDRNLMFTFTLIAAVTTYFLYQIIIDTFPLTEEVAVVLKEYDSSLYKPIIVKLKTEENKKVARNPDEMILRSLLENYVEERESFDYRDSDVKKINQKYLKIKNNSSYLEYKSFQDLMDKSNPSSPVNYFGQRVYKDIKINSFRFNRKKTGLINSLKSKYISSKIPQKAEINFTANFHSIDRDGRRSVVSKNFIAKLGFEFGGISEKEVKEPLVFFVKKYELFEVGK